MVLISYLQNTFEELDSALPDLQKTYHISSKQNHEAFERFFETFEIYYGYFKEFDDFLKEQFYDLTITSLQKKTHDLKIEYDIIRFTALRERLRLTRLQSV